MSCLRRHLTFQESNLDIDSSMLNAWKHGQLVNASLSAAISTLKNRARAHAHPCTLGTVERNTRRHRGGACCSAAYMDADTIFTPVHPNPAIDHLLHCGVWPLSVTGKQTRDVGCRLCAIALRNIHSGSLSSREFRAEELGLRSPF